MSDAVSSPHRSTRSPRWRNCRVCRRRGHQASPPFSDDEWQRVLLVEHGGMNEVSFNLYAITGKPMYRDLAYRFEHKKIFDPGSRPEWMSVTPSMSTTTASLSRTRTGPHK
ncbi:MAG TPA: beta-L-arabinofuranosidase domain-containing protein [Edaphobacter sp.]